jgi:hypothetical protein
MEGTGNETRTAYETALAVISPLAARQPNNDAAQRQKQSIETKLGALEPPRRARTP